MSAFRTVKSYWISKGSSFSTTITKQETELTPEMIASYVHLAIHCFPSYSFFYNFELVLSDLLCQPMAGSRISDTGLRLSSTHQRGSVQRWGLGPKGRVEYD